MPWNRSYTLSVGEGPVVGAIRRWGKDEALSQCHTLDVIVLAGRRRRQNQKFRAEAGLGSSTHLREGRGSATQRAQRGLGRELVAGLFGWGPVRAGCGTRWLAAPQDAAGCERCPPRQPLRLQILHIDWKSQSAAGTFLGLLLTRFSCSCALSHDEHNPACVHR